MSQGATVRTGKKITELEIYNIHNQYLIHESLGLLNTISTQHGLVEAHFKRVSYMICVLDFSFIKRARGTKTGQ